MPTSPMAWSTSDPEVPSSCCAHLLVRLVALLMRVVSSDSEVSSPSCLTSVSHWGSFFDLALVDRRWPRPCPCMQSSCPSGRPLFRCFKGRRCPCPRPCVLGLAPSSDAEVTSPGGAPALPSMSESVKVVASLHAMLVRAKLATNVRPIAISMVYMALAATLDASSAAAATATATATSCCHTSFWVHEFAL